MTREDKLANIIVRLKEVKNKQPELTLQKIADHTGVSFTTVSRVFSAGSETTSFRYDSIRPIAQMLLGIDNLDEGEDDEKALKAIIQFKDARIKELESLLEKERERNIQKLDKERTQSRTSIDFLKHQIELKDERITTLMKTMVGRNEQFMELNKLYLEAMKKLMP